MEDNVIISGLNNWKSLVKSEDTKAISGLFENCGNCFVYTPDDNATGSELLHIYPGVLDDELYYFVIPAMYDNAAYEGSFTKYTQICKVFYNLQSNRIPDIEAKERIDRWSDRYKTWIPNQMLNTKVGIFMAFTLDPADFEFEKASVTMGLKWIADTEPDRADLIVTNYDDTKVVYDDFARPVPPYGGTAAVTDFYLLTL